jgi:hypothetical protein
MSLLVRQPARICRRDDSQNKRALPTNLLAAGGNLISHPLPAQHMLGMIRQPLPQIAR